MPPETEAPSGERQRRENGMGHGPPSRLGDLGGAMWTLPRGLGQSHGRKRILAYFILIGRRTLLFAPSQLGLRFVGKLPPLLKHTTAPVLLPFCILPFPCLPFYCPPFPLSSKKWPPRAARSGEHYKYIKHLGVFLGKEMCLVATILAISVGTKTSIWIFWTKMVLSSDYIMWDDLLIQCRSVTCSYDTGLGTRPVWGQLLLCAP